MQWKDNGGGEFEQPPVGTHVARCIKVIDIGTQRGEYQGKETFKRQCVIAWELPNETMTQGEFKGKPFVVSKFYTASLNEKSTLRKDLSNWRGRDFTEEELKGFSPMNILGKACMLSLIKNEKDKIKVSGVMALPKGTQVPPQVNKAVFFSLDDYDPDIYEGLSDGYKKLIAKSPEYTHLASGEVELVSDVADMADDIPF